MESFKRILGLSMAICTLIVPAGAMADAYTINFDTVMTNVWTQSGIWPVVALYNVLPADFSLMPNVCDINGGFDISVTPIELFPNGILDSDEFALVAAILANPNFDCSSRGGTSHKEVHDAWIRNFNQVWHDLGGGVGGPEILLPPGSMIPDVEYLFAVMMTLGDSDTIAFPNLIMDLVVNDETVNSIIGDPNLHVPVLSDYTILYPYLGWCGDADGDGCSNLHEYEHFYPTGGRSAYLAAAMDPNVKVPGCPGDLLCDGTGGLLGEYFDERNMTSLKVTRVDPMVSFDWGRGQPHPDIEADTFSVCWTGYVIPQHTEAYTFSVRTDDGVRLWVNNELLVDEWNDHGSTTYSGTTSGPLTAGQQYPIRMDFYENGGDAVAWLGWESTSQPRKAIYEMYLVPGVGIGDRTTEWIRNPGNGHYYRLTEPMTWAQGQDLATSPEWHGYLCSINDAAENTWLYEMFGPVGGSFFFGGNDIATEGRWVWAEDDSNFWNGNFEGSAVPGFYSNWNNQEPNDAGGNEDAAQFYANSGKWNDINAGSSYRCIVESDTGHIGVSGPTPSLLRVFEGGSCAISVGAIRPYGTVTYQWKKDGVEIPGATSAVLVIGPVSMDDEGQYTCVISDDSLASDETPSATLMVVPESELPLLSAVGGLLLTLGVAAAGIRRMQR